VRFYPFRLVSRRASPWSALEIVKEQFQAELEHLADERSVLFKVGEVEHPVGPDVAFELLSRAVPKGDDPPQLILDISAFPRELAVYLCDIVSGFDPRSRALRFSKIFVVVTPPGRITSRQGLGPFSVGAAKCIYNHSPTPGRLYCSF
jgi:hypothetical protein